MKVENIKCIGKTDELGVQDRDGKYITFVVDMDDGTEYDLTMPRNDASNLHFALGKSLIETDFRYKQNF